MVDNSSGAMSKGFRWGAGLNILSFFVAFGGSIVLARMVGPEPFGEFVLLLAIVEILGVFIAFSPGVVVVQNREHELEDLVGNAVIFSFALSLVLFLLVCLVSVSFYQDSIFIMMILCAAKIVEVVSSIYVCALDRLLMIKRKAFYLLCVNLLAFICALGVAFWEISVWVFVTQYVFAKAAFGFVVWRMGRKYSRYKFDKRLFSLFFQKGRSLFFVSGLEKLKLHVDKFAVGTVLTLSQVGLYTRGRNLAQMFQSQVFNSIRPIMLSSISELQGDNDKTEKLVNALLFVYLWFSVSLLLIFLLFSKEIVLLLFGEDWLESANILKYMSLLGVISPLLIFGRVFLYGRGLYSTVNKIAVVEFLLLCAGYAVFFVYEDILVLIGCLTAVSGIALFGYFWAVSRIVKIYLDKLLLVLSMFGLNYFVSQYIFEKYFEGSFYLSLFLLAPLVVVFYLMSVFLVKRNYIYQVIGYVRR